MASKVLVPTAPFAKLQVNKSPPEPSGSGFIIGSNEPAARVAHLEHSIRFLQEQHRLMLSGLHTEIEALREKNRDLQFQLIFNKESSLKPSPPPPEEVAENVEETRLKKEVARLEREAGAVKTDAMQLKLLVEAQAEKLRELEIGKCNCHEEESSERESESRASLRARLAEAERLVRRLRSDADRQRREVHDACAAGAGAGVTNLLFDGALATHAHLQCMKNSLHASLRLEPPAFGFQNNYHFPPVPAAPDFWREPLREEFSMGGRGRRRPLTLPELAGHAIHRSTIYANPYVSEHTRPRANGYDVKNKKQTSPNGDSLPAKTPAEDQAVRTGAGPDASRRPRRQHRKHASTDHT